jgi:tRNA threonylcarbamoyladenosine biosynthesis protein TsaB
VLILALDTCSPAGGLAVLRNEELIGSVSTWTDEIYSSRMFRQLDFLLGELSLKLSEFDLFAVATGPGSFTGLRVGIAAVKGWAEVYRKPVAGISALEAIAIQSDSPDPTLIAVADARRGQLYCGCYRRSHRDSRALVLEGDERVMEAAEFVDFLASTASDCKFTIVTPVPALLSSIVSQYKTTLALDQQLRIDSVLPILAPHVGLLGYDRAQRGELQDALTLAPNYVRRTDAELKWKAPSGV